MRYRCVLAQFFLPSGRFSMPRALLVRLPATVISATRAMGASHQRDPRFSQWDRGGQGREHLLHGFHFQCCPQNRQQRRYFEVRGRRRGFFGGRRSSHQRQAQLPGATRGPRGGRRWECLYRGLL